MTLIDAEKLGVVSAVKAVIGSLVFVKHWEDASFVSLPIVYPSGSFVTVRVDYLAKGYRVSDNGFAYRETEFLGAKRSFGIIAAQVAEVDAIERNNHVLFVDVELDQLARAICDVGLASWKVVDRILLRIPEQEDDEFQDLLSGRLESIFGHQKVDPSVKMVGFSTSEWRMTAVVKGDTPVVFQAVGNHPNAIFRASSAFHDLADLRTPPKLVAVVHSKPAMGSRLGLLSRVSRVIEEDQSDEAYLRAAA